MPKVHPEEDKANALAALVANGGNVSLTAKQLGIPRKTLANWSKGQGINDQVAISGQQKQVDLATKLEAVAHQLVDSIPGKIKKATLAQVGVAMGISIEKSRLLRDKPTSITGSTLTDEERARRVDAILERARQKRAGQPSSNGAAAPVEAAAGPADAGVPQPGG